MKNSLIAKIKSTKPSPNAMIAMTKEITNARDTGKVSPLDYGILLEIIKNSANNHLHDEIYHLNSLSVTHPQMLINMVELHQAYADHNMLRINDAIYTKHEIQRMIVNRNHRNIKFRI